MAEVWARHGGWRRTWKRCSLFRSRIEPQYICTQRTQKCFWPCGRTSCASLAQHSAHHEEDRPFDGVLAQRKRIYDNPPLLACRRGSQNVYFEGTAEISGKLKLRIVQTWHGIQTHHRVAHDDLLESSWITHSLQNLWNWRLTPVSVVN